MAAAVSSAEDGLRVPAGRKLRPVGNQAWEPQIAAAGERRRLLWCFADCDVSLCVHAAWDSQGEVGTTRSSEAMRVSPPGPAAQIDRPHSRAVV